MRKASLLITIVMLLGALIGTVYADELATVNFEGLSEGQIVTSLTLGAGYTATVDFGTIGVKGTNTATPASQAAMIFDSNCVGGCTGGDPDLQSNTGNVLIVTEDFDSSDPDDRNGGFLDFNFVSTIDGAVTIDQLQLTDTEEGGLIELFNGDTKLGEVHIPATADGAVINLPIGFANVTFMHIDLFGSGSVDNIELRLPRQEEEPGEGCTPGFWKNRGLRAGYWNATGYAPTDYYDEVFGVGPHITLLDALNDNGGQERAFHRHSTAALLNEAHPDINYALSNVVGLVANGYWSEALKDQFDLHNNDGCFE